MPKIVCCKCQVEFEIEKNDVYVCKMFSTPPQPYKIWSADLWKCPLCEAEIIAGFGMQPLSEHFQDGFNDMLTKLETSGNLYYDYEK